ncbi:MAG: hypothetical protein MSH25_07830 [Desulfovibrio sp.]|uniref:hypothetical protein n=1 Tax=Desulfovibrio sp. TaxID=885 RepID=UPI0025B7E8CE|nr:hypothetical protein [Desulfovibrio sp.]MCI7569254.1 hypothetical protein [Desulfovibrio sp.]
MLFEQCFADLPTVNARDLVASWRPSYGEWLGAQAAEGFDHTTTGRYLEEKDIALEEMKAGEYDPAYALQQDADALSPGALRQAFALKGWTPPAPAHAHAMKEADWKASPWYRKEIPFRPDMTETRARIMAENFDRRRYRDQLLARGGEVYNGAGDMALGFGAALLGSLPDPISVLPVGGGMAADSRAGPLGRALLTGAKTGAVEGAVSTVLTDAVVLPDLASRGEDEGFADLALDTLAGGVLGSIFGASGGLLARRAALRRGASGGLLARAEEGPATQPGETFHPGEPLRDFDSSPDNGFLETAGQGPVTHDDAAQAARADNDLLRQSWTAGDRRAVADAVALGMNDVADGRPADVSAVLRESRTLERAYNSILRNPLNGSPDDVLATLQPEDIERVLVHRGPAVMRDGHIVVQGRALQRETGSKSGYGMVKIIFAHGEGGNKRPDLPPVTREDVVALPRLIRDFESFIDGEHRVWRIPREDGNALHIVTRHGEGEPGERLVSMYVGPLGQQQNFSAKKPPVASSALASYRSKDTGRGITLSHPAGEQGVSHRTDSSLPDTAAPVNRPVPDFSTAAEPSAPPRLTPDEARRAEAETPAGRDEALRQDMDDLEARGAADAGEVAASRTNAESSEALGREALNSAWAVEE